MKKPIHAAFSLAFLSLSVPANAAPASPAPAAKPVEIICSVVDPTNVSKGSAVAQLNSPEACFHWAKDVFGALDENSAVILVHDKDGNLIGRQQCNNVRDMAASSNIFKQSFVAVCK